MSLVTPLALLFLPAIPCFFAPIGLLLTVLWIWMLVEILTKEPDQGNDRVVWLIVVILTGWLGALIYLLARRPERIRKFGR
jgi:hypothetical protein